MAHELQRNKPYKVGEITQTTEVPIMATLTPDIVSDQTIVEVLSSVGTTTHLRRLRVPNNYSEWELSEIVQLLRKFVV